jgi:uncharacterized caspase-like protein
MRIFALVVFLLFTVVPASAAQRIALVIGNSAYAHATVLKNPANDANAMAKMLMDMNFIVSLGLDLDEAEMRKHVADFVDAAAGAELVVFFYAGHGTMANGNDMLLPTDFDPARKADALPTALPVTEVVRAFEATGAAVLAFVDTNRTNYFASDLSGVTALQGSGRGRGTLLAFSTAPGSSAQDGTGEHSPFAEALLKHLPKPGMTVEKAMKLVRRDVFTATKGKQAPFDSSSLQSDVVLAK